MEQQNAETYRGNLVQPRAVALFTSETILALDLEQVLGKAGYPTWHCITCDARELKDHGKDGFLAAVVDVTLHEAEAAEALPWLKRHEIPTIIIRSGAEVIDFEKSKFPNIVAEFEKPVIGEQIEQMVRHFRRHLSPAAQTT